MSGIKSSIKNLFESEFYRSIVTLFSGMFIARIVPAFFALIIARIYEPADFGLFVLYLTIASVLSIVTTGKYENAILLVDSQEEKRQIFRISQKINTTINGLVLTGIIISIFIFNIYETKNILLLLLTPFYAFFFSTIQLIRNIYISKKQFKNISVLEISRAVFIGLLQSLFFIFPEFGLFLGAVLAQGFIFIYYTWKVPEALLFNISRLSLAEIKIAKRYINFPKYSILSEGFNFISSQLPVFLIKPFFGNTMLGLYSFSHRYISVPVQLLSKSISSVYLQKSQALKDNIDELSELTFSLYKKQIVLGVLPFAVLGLWGAEIFAFVFGAEWEFSGHLAQIISPWLFAVMIGSPLSAILVVREKQKVSMIYNIALLAVRAISLVIGGLIYKDVTVAIALYSFTGFIFFVGLIGYSLWLAGVNLRKAAVYALKAILIIIPLIFIKIWL